MVLFGRIKINFFCAKFVGLAKHHNGSYQDRLLEETLGQGSEAEPPHPSLHPSPY